MAGQAIIDQGRLLETLGVEIEAVTQAAHSVEYSTPVPTCPGWTVWEVLRHLGSVYRVVRSWIVNGRRPSDWVRSPESSQPVVDYLRAGFDELYAELAGCDPGQHAATWWPADATCGFWRRRMLHETIIHRVDIQTASAVEVSGIADDVAVDGIDEILTLWFGQRLSMMGLTGTRDCSVAVHAGGHHWLAIASPKETVAWRCSTAETQRAEIAVSGAPAEVYLWLWGRAAPGTVTVEGPDEEAAGQLWALLRLATR